MNISSLFKRGTKFKKTSLVNQCCVNMEELTILGVTNPFPLFISKTDFIFTKKKFKNGSLVHSYYF